MAVTKIGEQEIKNIKEKVVLHADMNRQDHVSVIKEASKDLLDLLSKNEKYADIDTHKADLDETLKLLNERKESMEKNNSLKGVKASAINNAYKSFLHPSLPVVKVSADDEKTANDVWEEIEEYYEKFQEMLLITKLPKDFVKTDLQINLRKATLWGLDDTWIPALETKRNKKDPDKIEKPDIQNVITQLEKKANTFQFKAGLPGDLKEDVAKLLIIFTQLHRFYLGRIDIWWAIIKKWWDKELYKEQFDQLKNYHDIIKKAMNTLQAYKNTSEAIGLVEKRVANLDKLEQTKPKSIGTMVPNTTPSQTFALKDAFLDITKPDKLEHEISGYETEKILIKWVNEDFEVYADAAWVAFTTKLKEGQNADIFTKEWTTFKKFGNVEMTAAGELKITLAPYSDISRDIIFPASLQIEATGVGGDDPTGEHKTGITKTLTIELKPDFDKDYKKLDIDIEYSKKLEEMHDDLYETILQDQLNKFFENHPDGSIRNGWKWLSDDLKKTFFIDVVINNGSKPAPRNWPAGIKDIAKVFKDNVLKKDDFKKLFKKNILEWFTGRTKMELKEYILEKLWTEPFTRDNPRYAQWMLSDEVKKKYNLPAESAALRMAINKFMLWKVGKASDAELHPWLTDLHGDKEIRAVVADIEALPEEKAREEAIKNFDAKYAASMARWPTRAKMNIFRTHIINKDIKKYMKTKTSKKLLTDEETASAVNRWMIKKELKLEWHLNIKKMVDVAGDTTVFDDADFNTDMNRITNDYLSPNSTKSDAAFEAEMKDLIDNNAKLKQEMKEKNINHVGSNLIEKVKFEKEQRRYYQDLINITDDYLNKATIKTRADFDSLIRKKIAEFAEKQKRLPDLVKELQLDINAIDFAEQLVKHKVTLEKMRQRTVSMKLDMLENEHPKWQPKSVWEKKGIWEKFTSGTPDDKRGLTTAQHVQIDALGGRKTKLYRWMEKHPYWTTLGTSAILIGWAAIGTVTWPAMPLISAAMPAIGAGIGSVPLFTINYLKKRWHYTKEHMKFEKEFLAMTPAQREKRMEDLKTASEKRPACLRWAFPTQNDKYAESLKYLEKVESVEKLTERINTLVRDSKEMTPAERTALETELKRHLQNGIAAMKLQETEGRNFSHSEQWKVKIEKLYNDLHTSILWGLQRLKPTEKPEITYATIISWWVGAKETEILTNTDYAADKKKMEKMRTKLWRLAGIQAVGIYFGTARAMWQIVQWRQHIFGDAASSVPSGAVTGMNLDPALQAQVQAGVWHPVNFSNMSPQDIMDVTTRMWNNQYSLDPLTNQIYHSVTSAGTWGLRLDDAFGPNGQDLLHHVFGDDKWQFQAFQAKISTLSPSDRSTTLRWTFKDIYGTNELATEKTRAFFDHFGKSIIENWNHELITLTTQSPLSSSWADAIASKMTSRYTGSGLSGSEFNTVTDPTQIKALFDGFAKGTANGWFDLSNLPSWWNLQTANDVLHCKYGGFGDGLRDYIFDLGKWWGGGRDLVWSIITDPGDGATWWSLWKMLSAWVPTFRDEVYDRTKK